MYQLKAKEREALTSLEAMKLSSETKINPNSIKILKQSGQHTEEKLMERLNRPIGTIKQKTLETIDQPTFQPTITKKSKEIVESMSNNNLGIQYNNQKSNHHNQLLNTYYQNNPDLYGNPDEESETLYEYNGNESIQYLAEDNINFHPSLSNNYIQQEHSNSISTEKVTGPESVYLRSQKWLQEKQKRMLKEKQLKDELELNQCSFKPKIKESPIYRSDDGYQEYSDSVSTSTSGLSMAERQAEWKRKRYIQIIYYLFLLTIFLFLEMKKLKEKERKKN